MNFEAMQSTAINNVQHPSSNYETGNYNNLNNVNNFVLTNGSNPINLFENQQNGFTNQNLQQTALYHYNENQGTINMNITQHNNPFQSQFTSNHGQLPSYSNACNSPLQTDFSPQLEQLLSYNNSILPPYNFGSVPSYYNNSPPIATLQTALNGYPSKKVKINLKNSYIKIIEQPCRKPVRFRYTCEGRSAENILGEFSTKDRKSYPKVQICNYKGLVKLIVSCVTAEEPYRAHPHKLTGKNCSESGLCEVKLNGENMKYEFTNLGIQCVKKQDVALSIKTREIENVDPFKQGFTHDPNTIDLNSIRLCFQAFVKNTDGKYEPLRPVVTNKIFDVKAKSELKICRLCSCSSAVDGGQTIMLTCEKVIKENIRIRFFEENNGKITWEQFGVFEPTDVHKQTAIAFKTPAYHNKNIVSPVTVNIQLLRPTDNVTSEPVPFDYIPNSAVVQRYKSSTTNEIFQLLNNLQYDEINHLSTTQKQYDSIDEIVANTIPKVEVLSPNAEQSIQNQWNYPNASNNLNFIPNTLNQTYQNQIYETTNMLKQNNSASATNNFSFPNQSLHNNNNNNNRNNNNGNITTYDHIMENNSADLNSLSLNG